MKAQTLPNIQALSKIKSSSRRFKLTQQAALLGLISATFPLSSHAIVAGRADFIIGSVEAVATDGSRRPLTRGADINVGDAITTSGDARAQIRFTDGGFVSLQPNTLFRVDEFNYQNKTDGQEKGFFSLLKGGLRAITGAIGHVNRNAYRVSTPVATIGIRGTGYNAVLSDGLSVSVGEGAILLSNNVGQIVVTSGNAAFVASLNTPPTTTTEQPQTPAASLKPITTTFSTAENVDASGTPQIFPTLVSGSGYALAYAFIQCNADLCLSSVGGVSAVTADFSGTSQLIQYDNGSQNGALGSAAVTFSATDGIIGWGRWNGTTTGNFPHPLTLGVFDYVVGIPTAVMPTSGTATYSLIGFTTPATSIGTLPAVSSGSLTGALIADFGAGSVRTDLVVSSAAGAYTVAGGLSISGASFSNPSLSTGCSSICTTSIQGYFFGPGAVRAGLTYQIDDSGVNAKTVGAAAFRKN